MNYSMYVKFYDNINYTDYINNKNLPTEFEKIQQPTNLQEQNNSDTNINKIIRQDHDYARLEPHEQPLVLLATAKRRKGLPVIKLSDDISRSLATATKSKFTTQWIDAIDKELDAHRDNETWVVVRKPVNKSAIPAIWKFLVKLRNDIEVAKARLVAFGCADHNKYEINKTYSPVCKVENIRLLLALAVTKKLKILTVDITTAFLYGNITDDIYISQTE